MMIITRKNFITEFSLQMFTIISTKAIAYRMRTCWGNQVQILDKGHYCKANS